MEISARPGHAATRASSAQVRRIGGPTPRTGPTGLGFRRPAGAVSGQGRGRTRTRTCSGPGRAGISGNDGASAGGAQPWVAIPSVVRRDRGAVPDPGKPERAGSARLRTDPTLRRDYASDTDEERLWSPAGTVKRHAARITGQIGGLRGKITPTNRLGHARGVALFGAHLEPLCTDKMHRTPCVIALVQFCTQPPTKCTGPHLVTVTRPSWQEGPVSVNIGT